MGGVCFLILSWVKRRSLFIEKKMRQKIEIAVFSLDKSTACTKKAGKSKSAQRKQEKVSQLKESKKKWSTYLIVSH